MTHHRKMLSCAALLLGVALGSGCNCNNTDVEGQCQACSPRRAYRCPVPSTNNIICANDDAHALALCPEGPTALPCEAGSGGQANGGSGGQAAAPETKAPDATLESKAR